MIPHSPMHASALAYARRGWRVFPLHSVRDEACSCGREPCSSMGKHPRTKHGVKDATTDLEQIGQWWRSYPDANVGIATGNGLYVIDLDTAKGASVTGTEDGKTDFSRLLAESLSVRTGSGGYHIYLSYDPALMLGNTAGNLGPFIDTRGEGGYVVAPPSCNKDGAYRWLNGQQVLQPIPADLLSVLRVSTGFGKHYQRQEGKAYAVSYPAQTGAAQTTEARQRARAAAATSKEERQAQKQQATRDEVSQVLAISSNPQEIVAHEARNNYLMRVAGILRRAGLNVDEIRMGVLLVNEGRYGNGKHPNGPLTLEELEATIFTSMARLEARDGVQANGPQIKKLTDLMARKDIPINWVVPDLLSSGLILLAGKPKLGKSWLTHGLTLTCALGSEDGGLVLGRYPVEPMGVLYMGLEDGRARMQSRLKKLLGERPFRRISISRGTGNPCRPVASSTWTCTCWPTRRRNWSSSTPWPKCAWQAGATATCIRMSTIKWAC